VTALHGIIGCSTYSVEIPGTALIISDLKPIFVNLDSDLVILSSDKITATWPRGLTLGASSAAMTSIGFPFGIDQPIETRLTRRNPSTVMLSSLIPSTDKQWFDPRKSPDLNLSVLSIEGHLTPGDSGGPILNSHGEVVAVADGGLQQGAIEISWAIPLTSSTKWDPYLSKIDQINQLAKDPSQVLFDFSSDVATQAKHTKCFGADLYPVRTASFVDLVENSDDKNAVRSYIEMFGVDDVVRTFTIYRSNNSYLNIVTPSGWLLTGTATTCIADSGSGARVEYVLASASTAPTANSTLESEELTRFCGSLFDPIWSRAPKYALQRGVVNGHKLYVKRQQRCGPPTSNPNDIVLNWTRLSSPTFGGPSRCQPVCAAGSVLFPDYLQVAIPGYIFPIQTIKEWHFANYVYDSKNMLMAFTSYEDTTSLQMLLNCNAQLSFDTACVAAVEKEREWAAGVVAATASTLAPR
jgi:hypothetical protein